MEKLNDLFLPLWLCTLKQLLLSLALSLPLFSILLSRFSSSWLQSFQSWCFSYWVDRPAVSLFRFDNRSSSRARA